nr:MAG TPA: hypothetical protein [Caudoviricetes sp.]
MPVIHVLDSDLNLCEYDTAQCDDVVRLEKADGSGKVPFSYGERREVTVAPDFSDGDVTLTPAPGTLYNKVTITKPDTLLPENILSGTTVCGIQGSFKIPEYPEYTEEINEIMELLGG